jgi:hypothetical protein
MIPGGTRPFGFEPVSSVLESIPAAPLGGLCVSRLAHLRAPFAGRLATCTGQGLFLLDSHLAGLGGGEAGARRARIPMKGGGVRKS